ncbi:hypothetical protein GGX14DRAFT_402133 [Mycena pura]|uniref:Uncharacterized protein n=1 Tax=Mycena pura TaxID=153505 RepID=A0AAD6V5X4_9AGAR|nr:hypothetical protein GGX14DRAFT_402133 [Mycena pura]
MSLGYTGNSLKTAPDENKSGRAFGTVISSHPPRDDTAIFGTATTPGRWLREVQMGGFGSGEFEMTTGCSNNSFLRNGHLYIMIVPTLPSAVRCQLLKIARHLWPLRLGMRRQFGDNACIMMCHREVHQITSTLTNTKDPTREFTYKKLNYLPYKQ